MRHTPKMLEADRVTASDVVIYVMLIATVAGFLFAPRIFHALGLFL